MCYCSKTLLTAYGWKGQNLASVHRDDRKKIVWTADAALSLAVGLGFRSDLLRKARPSEVHSTNERFAALK